MALPRVLQALGENSIGLKPWQSIDLPSRQRLSRESSLLSLLRRLEESEREDIAFGRDCHVLPAVHLKRHWRRIQRVAGVEVPQVFASARTWKLNGLADRVVSVISRSSIADSFSFMRKQYLRSVAAMIELR